MAYIVGLEKYNMDTNFYPTIRTIELKGPQPHPNTNLTPLPTNGPALKMITYHIDHIISTKSYGSFIWSR